MTDMTSPFVVEVIVSQKEISIDFGCNLAVLQTTIIKGGDAEEITIYKSL